MRGNDKLGWVEWKTPKEMSRVNLTSVLQFLEGKIPCREGRAKFFLEVHSERTRGGTHQVAIWKILVGHKGKDFHSENSQILEQIAQRGY